MLIGNVNNWVIKLAPKTGSLEFIGNWRPIIIVCVDYKIIAKMKANRIKKFHTCPFHRKNSCLWETDLLVTVIYYSETLFIMKNPKNNHVLIDEENKTLHKAICISMYCKKFILSKAFC